MHHYRADTRQRRTYLREESRSPFDSHDEELLVSMGEKNHARHNANETQSDLRLRWRSSFPNHRGPF